ncbi:MBL fold metallo-hydrolase [Streptomyces sp. NPDC004561]
MNVTFVGQQSWLLEVAETRVLVDPVLSSSFGNSSQVRFEIFPAREIDTDALPEIDAVVVTNEHLDHFHLPSLEALPAHIPILMPHLMPAVCVSALRDLGRQVILAPPQEEQEVGNATVTFVAGPAHVPVWESRVASLYMKESGRSTGGIFVQSDTSLTASPTTSSSSPDVVIATHNAQIAPAGCLGAFDNLLPIPPANPPETAGIDLLYTLLSEATTAFPSAKWVLLSGGGYTQVPQKHGQFLWNDFAELAQMANVLSIDTELIGLQPGESFSFGIGEHPVSVSWIEPRESTFEVRPSDSDSREDVDLGADLPPLFDAPVTEQDQHFLVSELQALAPLLMLSELGRSLVHANEYLGNKTGPLRFACHLRGFGPQDVTWALNINTGRFERTDHNLRDALFNVPSGIDLNAADLLAVLSGRIHIWEVAVSRARQWYTCDRLASPVSFLYGALSEQVRPDLAARLYRSSVSA